MTKSFNNLDHEKQKQIINAALKEFAEKGFDQASTNKIVEEAKIGKGMLFYYFNSKQGLYLYLVDYTLDIIEREFLNIIDISERDLFARLKNIATIKMKFFTKYPNAINFISTIYLSDDYVNEEITKKIEKLQKDGFKQAYENIDFSLFRDDVDPKKAFQIIRWAFDGYEAEMKFRLKDQLISKLDLNAYWDEFYDYIDVMKQSFYK